MTDTSPGFPHAPEATEAPHSVPQSLPQGVPQRVELRIAGLTDVGRVREHNEDNYLIADLTVGTRNPAPFTASVGVRGVLFAVCDGMGGAAAGEIASQMAVDVIHGIVQDGTEPPTRDLFAQKLVASIQEAGARIFLAAKSNRSQRGMGTTATVAGVYDRTLFVGQVGDSRAYLFRGGRLRQITKDQSLVSKLIEAGQLTEAEAETYEHSHIILQALGTADTVSVDLSYVELRKGDAVLLCSDGLSGLITTEQMREALASTDDPAACCQQLTEAANEAGGHDNVTVIVARFDGEVPAPATDETAHGYQPYVLLEPVEIIPSGRASMALKVPDLPPPGADVKHRVSLVPAETPGADDDVATAEPAEDLRLPMAPRNPLATWMLAALTVAVLALVGWAIHRRATTPRRAVPAPVASPDTLGPMGDTPADAGAVTPSSADGG